MFNPHRVLVVASRREDAAEKLVGTTFESDRYTGTVVSPDEALAQLTDRTPACLLVVPPLETPDTETFIETVRAAYPDLPLVAVADETVPVSAHRAVAAGASDVVGAGPTALDGAALRERIEAVIAGADGGAGRVAPAMTDGASAGHLHDDRQQTLWAVLRGAMAAVDASSNRTDLDQQVCEHLFGTGLYTGVWYGRFDPRAEAVIPAAWAGFDGETLEDLRVTLAAGAEQTPYERVIDDGQMAVVRTLVRTSSEVRELAADEDSAALAVVPVTHEGRRFGVLSVYASRPDAFGVREHATLTALADLVGHAHAALERRAALLADAVVVLELALGGETCPLGALTAATGATLRYEATVAPPGGPDILYFTVTGCRPESLQTAAADVPAFTETDVVRDYGDGFEWEVVLATDERTVITAVTDQGATVSDLEAADGDVVVRAELTRQATVSSVVEALRREFPDVSVTTMRNQDRAVRTARGLEATLQERLTDRQLAVLREAHEAGYFERPRRTTGQELAAALDISSSTLHQHLTVALAKLVELALDPTADWEPSERDQ